MKNFKEYDVINENLALVYGTMLGDGCLSKNGRGYFVVITCDLNSDMEFMKYILSLLEQIRGKNIKLHKKPKYGVVEINFSDKKLFNMIKELGFPIGKKGINISIPPLFSKYMKQIIQGYFATDGSLVLTNNNGILYPRIEFSGISKPLLSQVKKYLDEIGISGNIYLSKKYKNTWNNLYRLQINGKKKLKLFENTIGFVNPKHKKRFINFFTIK
jgi:hypothetical protein